VGAVKSNNRVMKDPQLRHRNMVLDLQTDDGRKASVTGNPMKFKLAATEAQRYPRGLGADTAAVLKDVLDLSPDEIGELLRVKAITARDFGAG